MSRLLVTAALLLLGIVVLAPLGRMVVSSLRVDEIAVRSGRAYQGVIRNSDSEGVMMRVHGEQTSRYFKRGGISAERRAWSLSHYRMLFRSTAQGRMLLATLALAGASTLIAVLIGLPLGVLFAATNLPGRRVLEVVSAVPLILPPILFAIATYYDLLLISPPFLRAAAVFGLTLYPLVSLFTARAIRATGADALAAARLQVAPREALARVVLGPALPGAAAGALLVFVFVVGDFAVPDFLGVTTAKNTISVYANEVFRAWRTETDAGRATAAGMPATLLALLAFAAVLLVERRRESVSPGAADRGLEPLPLGRARVPALVAVGAVLALAIVLPAWRHLEEAGGKHFGNPIATGGAVTGVTATSGASGATAGESDARPRSILDGLRRGLRHDRVGRAAMNSLTVAGGGALLAVLLALLLVEAGRAVPRLDAPLLIAAFIPAAVPPMSLSVGWVEFFGAEWTSQRFFPVVLMGARLLPFAMLAARAARRRLGPELLEAAAVAGLTPARRFFRVTLPLVAPGALLGLFVAFLFGLREVDAIIFTKTGAETLPVQLYQMIHYGYDVQVAGLSFLWTLGIGLFLAIVMLLLSPRVSKPDRF